MDAHKGDPRQMPDDDVRALRRDFEVLREWLRILFADAEAGPDGLTSED